MAKNGSKKKGSKESGSRLQSHTKHGILTIVFFVLALFLLLSRFDMAGVAGEFIYEKLHFLLGVGYILLPALFILLGSSFLKSETPNIGWTRTVSAILFLLSGLGMIDISLGDNSGGFLGEVLSTPFVYLFDNFASIIFLGAILIISILIMFDTKVDFAMLFKKLWTLIMRKKEQPVSTLNEEETKQKESAGDKIKKVLGIKEAKSSEAGSPDASEEAFREEEMPIRKSKRIQSGLISTYTPPPLSLLEEDKGKPNTGDIKANST